MDAHIPPLISSFIIRFVVEETPAQPTVYHGTIRHIQTAVETNFNEWREAMEFMCRFVPLNELQPPSPPESPISNL